MFLDEAHIEKILSDAELSFKNDIDALNKEYREIIQNKRKQQDVEKINAIKKDLGIL